MFVTSTFTQKFPRTLVGVIVVRCPPVGINLLAWGYPVQIAAALGLANGRVQEEKGSVQGGAGRGRIVQVDVR